MAEEVMSAVISSCTGELSRLQPAGFVCSPIKLNVGITYGLVFVIGDDSLDARVPGQSKRDVFGVQALPDCNSNKVVAMLMVALGPILICPSHERVFAGRNSSEYEAAVRLSRRMAREIGLLRRINRYRGT